jgi:hypothetical protein
MQMLAALRLVAAPNRDDAVMLNAIGLTLT